MNDNKDQQQRNEGVGEQNPTLNNPGTKVADYGNPSGGSATENNNQNQHIGCVNIHLCYIRMEFVILFFENYMIVVLEMKKV